MRISGVQLTSGVSCCRGGSSRWRTSEPTRRLADLGGGNDHNTSNTSNSSERLRSSMGVDWKSGCSFPSPAKLQPLFQIRSDLSESSSDRISFWLLPPHCHLEGMSVCVCCVCLCVLFCFLLWMHSCWIEADKLARVPRWQIKASHVFIRSFKQLSMCRISLHTWAAVFSIIIFTNVSEESLFVQNVKITRWFSAFLASFSSDFSEWWKCSYWDTWTAKNSVLCLHHYSKKQNKKHSFVKSRHVFEHLFDFQKNGKEVKSDFFLFITFIRFSSSNEQRNVERICCQ